MAAYSSSSLVADDTPRKGLLNKKRKSKQEVMEKKKMFSPKKTVTKDSGSGFKKQSAIDPSDAEFDDMMEASVTHDKKKKRSIFQKKQIS